MPTYVSLNAQSHSTKRWKRPLSYTFAHKEITAPIIGAEFPQAGTAFPIAFLVQQESISPIVLMGFEQGKNLFMDNTGKWLGAYTPMIWRVHPFKLARTENEQMVLCIDQDSDLITEGEGESLFDAEGNPTAAVKSVLDLLNYLQAGQAATTTACSALAKHGLLKPWPLTFTTPSGPAKLNGLFQIDEQALNQLADDAFLELRRAGALPLAYCQLLSMMQVPGLERMAASRKPPRSSVQHADLPTVSFDEDMFRYG